MFPSCVHTWFTIDKDNGDVDALKPIVRCVRANRELLRTKDKPARSEWIMDAFKRMMVCNEDGTPFMHGVGQERFTHRWTLISSDSQTTSETVEVCRDVFCEVYGITKYEIDRAAIQFRLNQKAVRAKPLKPYKDKNVMQYDFPTTREIFLTQVIDRKTGLPIETVDDEMIRAAMLPFSEKEMFANTFLQRHFAIYGDAAPDQNLVQVSTPWRHDIFLDYERHVDLMNQNNPLADLLLPLVEKLDEKEFTDFWAALYPNHVTRKYVNVCGKCATCYEIDKCRQATLDR